MLFFVLPILSKYRYFFINLLFVTFFGGFTGIYINFQIKLIIDSIDQYNNIFLVIAWFGICVLANHGIFFISRLLDIKYKPLLLEDVVKFAYDKTMLHNLHWFDSHLSGEISNKIVDLQDSVITIITVIFRSLSMLVFVTSGIIFLFNINYICGCIILSFILLYVAVMQYLLKKQLRLQIDYINARQSTIGIINDSIANVFNIKVISNLASETLSKLMPSLKNWSHHDRKTRLYDAWYVDMADTIISVCMHLVNMYVLTHLYSNNVITSGEFAFIMITILQIHEDIENLLENILFSINPKIATIKASLQFIEDIQKRDLPELPSIKGSIEYKNIDFGYTTNKIILKNFNLKIEQSQRIGIVGASGAGKTTLIKSLLQYLSPTNGEILLDEYNIFKYSEESVRANIAVIPQDITMFHRSIIDNLRIAKFNATFDEVVQSCKMARIHDDIMQMPQQYDTIVGERGVKLSGGQRQRIAIARAMLKNAPILILDEATSALDSSTETLIQQSIEQILNTSNATMLVIAHRLSTLLRMHKIIVIDDGQIIESGTHEELLKIQGVYYNLWKLQSNGFIN